MEELLAALEGIHYPKTDLPYSLVSWTYCACGAMASRIDEDGYATIGPVAYDKCPTVVVMKATDPEVSAREGQPPGTQ